jgi:hypothetical protein
LVIAAHWDVLAAADFFTVEVRAPRGLVTFYVFFVIELSTRKIEIVGITPGPNEGWMMQVGRNLTDPMDGFLAEKELLILDRDSKYSTAFRDLLKGSGVEIVRLPPRSPNLNAYAERFVRSIKDECLNRMIFFGERSLRKATREYATHYHRERNHQGIDNRLIEPDDRLASTFGAIDCVQRLGGLLRFYHRAAAKPVSPAPPAATIDRQRIWTARPRTGAAFEAFLKRRPNLLSTASTSVQEFHAVA